MSKRGEKAYLGDGRHVPFEGFSLWLGKAAAERAIGLWDKSTFQTEMTDERTRVYALALALQSYAREQVRAALEEQRLILRTFDGCHEHVHPKDGCLVCKGRKGTLKEIELAMARAAALATEPSGG
jgi:hypothetical protein